MWDDGVWVVLILPLSLTVAFGGFLVSNSEPRGTVLSYPTPILHRFLEPSHSTTLQTCPLAQEENKALFHGFSSA